MALVTVQTLLGETGPGHQPGGFTGDLRAISVGVAEDTVEHLTVAGGGTASAGSARDNDIGGSWLTR